MTKSILPVISLLLLSQSLAYSSGVTINASAHGPDIAFYYQSDLPVDELQMFDVVVIDPARSALPAAQLAPHTAWFARLNLDSFVRQPSPDAQAFVKDVVAPLWGKGYRGFLLDDGARLDAAADRVDEQLGAVLDAIKSAYPDAHLMLRNHLALAQTRASDLYALVVDALYHERMTGGYGGTQALTPESLRTQALTQIRAIRAQGALPVIAIDYCTTGDQACRRKLAGQIAGEGLTPFVTTPGFGTVGVGRIEVMPRKILMVQSVGDGQPLDLTTGAHDMSMPLNYLGYDIQYVDLNKGLPSHITNDRYAGIVVSIDRPVRNAALWRQWLLARIGEGMRVAVLGQFGFPLDSATSRVLGLDIVPGPLPLGQAAQVEILDPMLGFEIMPEPDLRSAVGIRVGAAGRSLLRINAAGYVYDAAGLLPWGGYALDPYAVVSLNAVDINRWAIQPIDFFRQALALPDMPVPDLTSENGRRLMFTHVDGDGFASKGEFARARTEYSGQVLYQQIFTKYKIPMSVSVIEGEIGAAGMYPQLSPALEPIARKIFALPNVEIASHTFSHPFNLEQIDNTTGERMSGVPNGEWGGDAVFSLDIPNYKFSVDREIKGSIDYINQNLAPPGKSVTALFWPGNAAAPIIALRRVAEAGVMSINGGDTIITKSNDSWTNIAPYGLAKGNGPGEYQVYAGTMNENVYTNDWMGPYYGFRRVLETFAMTDKPIRFKPIDIYYHFYSGTKEASLQALHTVFDSVLKQAVTPIYTTDYIQRVMEWRRVGVARAGNRWIVRSGSTMRQLRWPGQDVPELSTAAGVAGYLHGSDGLYIHMGADEASFSVTNESVENLPYISQASGFIRDFDRAGDDMQFEFGGYYKPFIRFSNVAGCRFTVDGKPAKKSSAAGALQLSIDGHPDKPVSYHSVKVNCE